MANQSIEQAYNLAKEKLLENKGWNNTIKAGKKHYIDPWARDNIFSSLGLLEINEFKTVENILKTFLDRQRKDGLIPFRIGDSVMFFIMRFWRIKVQGKFKPRFREDKGTGKYPTDQNSLIIILFLEFIKKTNRIDFLREYIDNLEKAAKWYVLKNKDCDPLIEEHNYCAWTDSVRKNGKVLYSNVCYCHSLFCLSELFLMLGNKDKANQYLKAHEDVKDCINLFFWNNDYYIDWINNKAHKHFSTDGNILAILWDIATPERANKIQDFIDKTDINKYVPSLTNAPEYPKHIGSSLLYLIIGLPDYHNGLSWLWLGAADAMAKFKIGRKNDAILLMDRIAKVVNKRSCFYEVYEKDGKPLNRLFYKSEQDFSWSMGAYIWAYNVIFKT